MTHGSNSRRVRSLASFLVATLLIGIISYLGVHTFKASHAATGSSLYFTPDSASVAPGSTMSVTLRENSGTDPVNSVQASLNYDVSKLQFISLTEGGTFPLVAATSTSNAGVIRVGRANADKSVTGDNPVVTINFKVAAGSGIGKISLDRNYSSLVRTSDNQDILQNVGSGSYTITAATPPPTPPTGSTHPVLSISPASGSFAPGATINAVVRLNSYSIPTTTVEAVVSYPSSQLQYVSTTEGGVYTTKQRTKISSGSIDLIRAIAGGSDAVGGDNIVATLSFKVIGSSGSAVLGIAASSAAFDNSGTGQNVLNIASSTNANYNIVVSGSTGNVPPVTSSTPPTGTAKTVATVTTASQSLILSASDGQVALATASDGSTVTELGGNVLLRPVLDSASAVSKVEYYLNGKLLSTQNTAPYSYKFDSQSLRNGTYTMVLKTYYADGTVGTKTDKLLVNNKITLAYVTRHYLTSIVTLLAILALLFGLIWKLVIPQVLRRREPATLLDHDVIHGYGARLSASQSAGLVAADPQVVSPNFASSGGSLSAASRMSDFSSNPGGSIQPIMQPTASQTTQALPMSPAVSIEPIQLTSAYPAINNDETHPAAYTSAVSPPATESVALPSLMTIPSTTPITTSITTPIAVQSAKELSRPSAVDPTVSVPEYWPRPVQPANTVPAAASIPTPQQLTQTLVPLTPAMQTAVPAPYQPTPYAASLQSAPAPQFAQPTVPPAPQAAQAREVETK